MKPLEFKIEKQTRSCNYSLTFYYEDGTSETVTMLNLPEGLELGKHYSIADIYGYKVVDDRKGL